MVAIPNDLGLHSERQNVWKAMASFDLKGSILLSSSVGFLILGLVSYAQTTQMTVR